MRASPEQIEEILSRPTCSVEEAASVLGFGRGTTYKMVQDNALPAISYGKRRLVKTAALRRMIADQHATA
jgi:excisionase family DNA binding protein